MGATCHHLRALSRGLVLGLLVATLTCCGGGTEAGASPDSQDPPPATKAPDTGETSEATGAAYTLPDKVVTPTMAATDSTAIDLSGVAQGYVGAAAVSPSRLKFQVRNGEMTYNYDMPNDGSPSFFPINMGDGSYAFRIMENIEGSEYAELDALSADVTLESEFAPFLTPNIFCNYTADSACVAQAFSLAKDATNEGEVVRDVCTFVADTVTYDYDKAEQLAQGSGYIPDPDATLRDKTGICFDYAALTGAMLRSLGMPTKIVTGFVSPDDLYHAWVMVYADGTWQTAQFSVTPKTWSRCDVTFASAGAGTTTGDGTTYTDRFTY